MQIGGRLGHDGWNDGNGDAPRRCRGDVDIGRRDFHRRHRAQVRVGGNDIAIDAILQQAEQDIVLAHRGAKLVLGQDMFRIRIPCHVGHVAQAFDRAARYGLGDEHAWGHGNSRRREIGAQSLN